MRFVDDQRVVLRQPTVGLDFRQQDTVGHELDRGLLAHRIVEAHLKPHRTADGHLQFFSHPPRHRTRRNPARLGATNHPGRAAPGQQAQLGQLRGLAAAGFTGNHHHLVTADQFDDVVGVGGNRQAVIDGCAGKLRGALRTGSHRDLQRFNHCGAQCGICRVGLPFRQQPQQTPTVTRQRGADPRPCLARCLHGPWLELSIDSAHL